MNRTTVARCLHRTFLLLLACSSLAALAQQTASRSVNDLPDAPAFGSNNDLLTGAQAAGQPAPGMVSGTVLDINGSAVPRATVTLVALGQSQQRTVRSDDAGRFNITDLPPGSYKVTIVSSGLQTLVASVVVHPGERYEMPRISLAIASASADVQVVATQAEIATAQVQLEEKQRVLGIFPNFYSSYIWNAAPLSTRLKFSLATRSLIDPVIFLSTGALAGIQQANDTFPAYGQGAEGYGKRYGAGYADLAISRMLDSAVLPTLFRQDPRYFYRGTGTKKSRALYALSRAVITRGDNGNVQPNYSYVLGSFAAGGIANAYHPAENRGAGLTIRNGFIDIAGHAADNLIREFLFKRFTPNVPPTANGKSATP